MNDSGDSGTLLCCGGQARYPIDSLSLSAQERILNLGRLTDSFIRKRRAMSEKTNGGGTLRSFPGQYWLAILFEFFERGSYYGMMSVLSVYLTDILGFAKPGVGIIKGTIQPILYFLPIISGALADRFGYRKTLIAAFALLGSGYALTSQMTTYTAVFMALCLMALGAGTFKPIISGSIARMTTSQNSTLGFGIYYWSINLGAFLFPLILVPFLKNNIGWDWVIIASALGTGAMLIPAFLFFKEPLKSESAAQKKSVNLIQTLANAFEIIYSPIILIYHWLRNTKTRTVFVFMLGIALLGLGIWNYAAQQPVVESLEYTVLNVNSVTLAAKVDRDVMRKNPFTLKDEMIFSKAGKRLFLALAEDSTKTECFKAPVVDGADMSTVIYHPADPELPSQFLASVKSHIPLSESELDSVIGALRARRNNLIYLTLYRPDDLGEARADLLQALQAHPPLAGLTGAEFDSLLAQSRRTPDLLFELRESAPAQSPYEIHSQGREELHVFLSKDQDYAVFKTNLLAEIQADPAYSLVSQSMIDALAQKLQQRSFFFLFVTLVLITSLLIVGLQDRLIKARPAIRGVCVLLCVALIGLVIWLLPGVSLFGRIVSTVIYATVLSLFLIDSDDIPKFKDHFKFLLMVCIYSGFWILYFQMFDSVLWYVKAYVDASSLNAAVNSFLGLLGIDFHWFFDVEHVTVINAGTIILLQLVVSSIVKNTKALPTMIVGILLGTLGMAILAISTGIWVFMLGIIIFSVGEMTAHPKFISYVGQTAPKERLATYMGYIFLYGVIGSSIGSILGANLYVQFVDKMQQPKTLWLIFTGIGVVTILALLLYNKFLALDNAEK